MSFNRVEPYNYFTSNISPNTFTGGILDYSLGDRVMNVSLAAQTVVKDQLVSILEKNREAHQELYVQAVSGYQKKAREQLLNRVSLIDEKQEVNLLFNLPVPVSHTEDYDTVIGLLKLSTAEMVQLGLRDYQQLVEDKWDWSQNFGTMVSGYCAN